MQINIRDLMENIEDSSVELEEKDVVSSERIKELTKMKINTNEYGFTTKRSSKKKFITVLVAAAVVSAVGISAYAAFRGGLEGVSFGDPTDPSGTTTTERIEVPVGPDGQATDGGYAYEPPMNHLISLQGYSDTNEFKASKEWREFEDGYDQDWKIVDAYDKECKKTGKEPFEEKYPGYGIYSKEMADKVDELCKKYNLKLRGKFIDGHSNPEDPTDTSIRENELKEMFGDIWDDKIHGAGYRYENGTFSLDADYEKVSFQIRRVIKGTFDTVYLNVGDISQYKQWTYKTKCGVEVAIALQDRSGVVLANTPKGFVAINLCTNEDENGKPITYTQAQIEEFVDHINFDKL